MNEVEAKDVVKILKSLQKTAEICVNHDKAIMNVGNTLLAKIHAIDAEKMKEKDYKNPMVNITEDSARYSRMESQFKMFTKNLPENRVTWTSIMWHRPHTDQKVVLGVNTDNDMVWIDENYMDIAVSVGAVCTPSADKCQPIYYSGTDGVYAVIAPVIISEHTVFMNDWNMLKNAAEIDLMCPF